MDTRRSFAILIALAPSLASYSTAGLGQTTSGSSATVVVPVIAQTSSFGSEVTVYNPNAGTITVDVSFYDAQNTGSPGSKPCSSLSVAAGRSTQFALSGQCTLPSGSNFGLLVLSEQTGTQRFYGYARTQNPQGIGFSTEGFPIENFNDQVQYATGLKRTAGGGGLPPYQTNCFVGTLGDAVNYQLALYDGTTGAQIGSTLSGTLQAWQQYRYLSILTAVGAPGGDVSNVRAQFTNLTGAGKKLIGFCTVQDNASFGADFRIAKSYGGTPQNAFVQGGNAFGTTALLGTTDNQPLTLLANNQPVARYYPNAVSPNLVGGHANNIVDSGHVGQTIGGGGTAGNTCFNPPTGTYIRLCGNQASRHYATVSGGLANTTSGNYATVGGGYANTASDSYATVGGGYDGTAGGYATTVGGGLANTASGVYATVGGGNLNTATGDFSVVAGGASNVASGTHTFAAGHHASANQDQCAVFGLWDTGTPVTCLGISSIFRIGANHGFAIDYETQRGDGGGTRWVAIGDTVSNQTISTWTGAYLSNGGAWINASDRALKTDFQPIDPQQVLAKVATLPITKWRYKSEEGQYHLGPVAQDFHSTFGLGAGDQHIATVDESGVALVAIQGLHRLIQEKDGRIASLEAKVTAQRQALQDQQREIAVLQKDFASVESLRAEVARLAAHLTAARTRAASTSTMVLVRGSTE